MVNVNQIMYSTIFEETSIEGKIKGLEELKLLVQTEKNRKTILKHIAMDFAQYIYAVTFRNPLDPESAAPYQYIDTKASINLLISKLMICAGMDKKSFETMADFTLDYLRTFEADAAGSNELMRKEVFESIINLPFVNAVLKMLSLKSPTLILNVDAVAKMNSMAFPGIGTIVNSRTMPQDDYENRPEYVFLHEVGHLFNAFIDPACENVPESFGEVIQVALGNDINKIPKEDLLEIFADCFAIACVYKTKYENTNPFYQKFRPEDLLYITDYFYDLLEDMLHELLGKRRRA